MNIQRWVARRRASWQELEQLLQQAEKRGVRSLSAVEIRRMASLYRSVSGDLTRARTQGLGSRMIHELQQLTTRGYTQIYQGSRRQEWQTVWQFYRWGFPAVVQDCAAYIALATAMFGLAALTGWGLAWADPAFITVMVPPELIAQVRDRQELWMGSILGIEPFASSSIMINNIQVSLGAIAGGMTAGLFTTYIMLINGVLIGTIAVLVGQNNLALPFWAFVFPHGALELPAIFLAGGGGLLLARALLFPGRLSRQDALRRDGFKAVQLLYGIVPLLAIAGVIEGFFSPQPAIPDLVKYLVGTALFAGLVFYLQQRPPTQARPPH